MGMHYDFELMANLCEETPQNIIHIIQFLVGQIVEPPAELAADPFFSGDHWKQHPFAAWAKDGDCHAGAPICDFRRVLRFMRHGVEHFEHTLHLRFNSKFETIAEIGIPFAMWLAKWSNQNEFVGYYKCEDERHPTLLYFHNGELYLREASEPPQRATDGSYWT